MNKISLALAAFLILGSVAIADGESADSIVTLSASQIREDAAQLAGWEHISSGQPDRAVLEVVSQAGFKTVVDMRGAGEDRGFDEAEAVEALDMRYVSFPIAAGSADDVTYENAAKLDRLLAEADGPILLHCASGNRVGALFALREKLGGATDSEALAAGRAAGLTRLEAAVKRKLSER